MLEFPLSAARRGLERVLAVGCHADDIEIGSGGTLLALTRSVPGVHVTWVVLSASGPRAAEAQASAEAFLADAGGADVRIHDFPESFFPYAGGEVKSVIEGLKDVEPDLVLTHTRHDLHQDHRLACELCWNTFRDQLILEYEIPKFDGDLGTPNVYVPLDEALVEEKIALLGKHFQSQAGKHWFDHQVFRGLLRIRGMESVTAYAEAFMCRKLRLVPE